MSKNGKKAVYVNTNIYAESVNEENINKDLGISPIPDKIRFFSSNFWTNKNNKLVKASIEPFFNINTKNDVVELHANKTKFFEDTFENGLLTKKFNSKSWQQFVEEIIPQENEVFEDAYFNFSEPINLAESPNTSTTDANYINREFVFNFFSPKFEGLVGDQLFDVTVLPTVYNILNDKNIDTKTSEENLIVTLGGLIPQSYADPLYTSVKENDLLKEYFNQYSDAFQNEEIGPVIKQIKAVNTDILLTFNKLSLIKKLNNKFIPFPFYSILEFSNIPSTSDSFVYTLRKLGALDEELVSFVQNQFNIKETNFIYNSDSNITEEVALQEIDFKNWISSNLSNNPGDSGLEAATVVKYTELIEYIKENLKNKYRSPDKFTTDSSHTEILFYKIEKRQFNFNKKNKPISTYYLLPDYADIVKFVDTQIKYGTEYYYTLTAYTLVIGTEYKYSAYYTETDNFEKNNDVSNGIYKIKIAPKAFYKLYEVPMVKVNGAAYEKPYTKPSVKLYQQDNSLLFELLDSDLKNFENFKVIENNDFKIFEALKSSQDNEDPETIESLINNTNISRLQIFRTTSYPKNYLSFQGKLYKTLILEDNQKTFLDNIIPNVKYYYCFRFLNQHDIPSNTTLIKEILLKEEDGYFYLETSIIDLDKEYPRSQNKGMKRYLLIRPSIIQTQPQFDGDVQKSTDVRLGPKSNSVWDKQFELTIKSNKSNRLLKFLLKATIK